MTKVALDVRFGHDLKEVQNESGVDLLLHRQQRALTVEQRFLNLEKQLEFLEELRKSASR
jgi:hypothetical protein